MGARLTDVDYIVVFFCAIDLITIAQEQKCLRIMILKTNLPRRPLQCRRRPPASSLR